MDEKEAGIKKIFDQLPTYQYAKAEANNKKVLKQKDKVVPFDSLVG